MGVGDRRDLAPNRAIHSCGATSDGSGVLTALSFPFHDLCFLFIPSRELISVLLESSWQVVTGHLPRSHLLIDLMLN
jgi:hypothetical protein